MTKEEAKQKITGLVEKYQKLTAKDIKGFNEAATKQGFIEPMFKALGWDFENTNEVSPEESASNGRVDYAFKLNNVSQFYVEAKSLKADLNREDYMKQAVSYSYARGVTWAILTDFESLRVFNALKKPFISLSCTDYVRQFDDVWLLCKQATIENELNKKAQAYGAMPPFIPIEKRLFKQLSLWRENLFNEIYRYNEDKRLEREQVDSIIQKLFNRLIFIRTAEDRKIEENGLRALLNQWKTAGSKGYLINPLRKLFLEYDGYYDSELFSHHLLDEDIFIDNESLQPVLEGLYEIPGSLASYNFNDIDADVLGAVYEQYLGHIAEVVKQKAKDAQARMSLGIETPTYTLADKKERRKEHGIYYTPKYITDYIVKETVGKFLLENAGYPDKLRNLKILDPACGSGSFLIRAYDELLKYHADELKKPVHQLDQWERLPILTNNIFGVDLDKQAVEVARLNLLLRSLAKREPLPYLGNNIKNGNSLISGMEEELKNYFGDNWKDKNPFNWGNEFKDIMKNGGFDVVIGNPPYISVNNLDPLDRDYFMCHYETAAKRFDIYVGFIERGLKLLMEGGRLGFIIPYPFLSQDYAEKLRVFVLNNCTIEHIVDFSEMKVFADPVVKNIIITLKKETVAKLRENNKVQVLIPDLSSALMPNFNIIATVPQDSFSKMPQTMFRTFTPTIQKILSKISSGSFILGKICVASWGARGVPIQDFHLEKSINDYCKPMIKGKNVKRYMLAWDGQWLLYDLKKLYRPAFPALFENNKIVISKVTGDEGIVSSYDDKGYEVGCQKWTPNLSCCK